MPDDQRPTLVFCLEEHSAKAFLETFLVRAFPSVARLDVRYIVFEGKRDMDLKLERRLRLWQQPNSAFVVLRDQDSAECQIIKRNLVETCRKAGRNTALVRIACRELESWYIGDLRAVDNAMGTNHLSRQQNKNKYRAPDILVSPSHELESITKGKYQKVAGSREIGKHLNPRPESNRSRSFLVFFNGLKTLLDSLLVT